MSVLLPGDVPWITSASVTRQLTNELLPHLDAELRKPWEESELEGVDLVDLSQLSERNLERVRVALGHVISEVEARGPSGYPVPSQFPGYVSKLQELQTLLEGCA